MKGQGSKLLVVTVAFLLIAGACAPAATPTPTATPMPPTPTPDSLAVVKAYQDAIARSDVDAAMALFTDDAIYDLSELTFRDKTSIRNWLEYIVALNTQTKSSDCTPGLTVVCQWRFTNDCCTTGFDLTMTLSLTVKGDKIAKILVGSNYSPEYNQWEQAFASWANVNYPAELAAFGDAWSKGTLTREVGETITKVCKAYAESQK